MSVDKYIIDKLKHKLIGLMVFILIMTILIVGEILVTRMNNKLNSPEIISVNGIAYIQKGDYACKLLDKQGRQIAYNDYLWNDHKFESSNIGEDYIFRDTYTGMIYVLIDSEYNNIPSVNIMYNNSWLEENEELNLDKNTITIKE